jgi:hypothetical protein
MKRRVCSFLATCRDSFAANSARTAASRAAGAAAAAIAQGLA